MYLKKLLLKEGYSMTVNKISSNFNYTIDHVGRITTNNNILKRPYSKPPRSFTKKQVKSSSFNDTLNSLVSSAPYVTDSENFHSLFDDQLNDSPILINKEHSRIIKDNFDNNSSKNTTSSNKPTNEHEINTELADAQRLEIDSSILCKKIELLNSLKR